MRPGHIQACAEVARAIRLPVSSGERFTNISVVSTWIAVHLDATIPNFTFQDHVRDEDPPTDDLLVQNLKLENGYLVLPEAAGHRRSLSRGSKRSIRGSGARSRLRFAKTARSLTVSCAYLRQVGRDRLSRNHVWRPHLAVRRRGRLIP